MSAASASWRGRWERQLLQVSSLRIYALLLAVALALGVNFIWSEPLSRWEEGMADLTWKLADPGAVERRIVVVDIDEKSVAALGPWPWPRERMAQLLQQLDTYGAGLKIVDVLFDGTQTGDVRLERALGGSTPAVIAQLFSMQPQHAVHHGIPAGALDLPCPASAPAAYGHMAPPSALAGVSSAVGHITPTLDPDGAIRRVPAIICHDGKAYLNLALASLSVAGSATPVIVPGQGWTEPAAWIQLGDLRVPVDSRGEMRVSYQTPRQGFIAISAVDVLTGKAPAELLEGVWALVGSTAMGAGDAVPTPQGGAVGGVEVHAQLLAAALDARTPFQPRWAPFWPWLAGLAAIVWLLLVLRISQRHAGIALPLGAFAAVAALIAAHAGLLLVANQWLGWGRPALFILLVATLLGAAEMLRVRIERERLYHNLASYLPEGAARRVAFAEPNEQVYAERRSATVMFVDMRNFSAYCEGRSPEEAATVLHLFYTTLERIVAAHGGVVEQMIGDGLMAVWNGSTPCPEHAARAVAAAPVIRREGLAVLPAGGTRRSPPLDLGIGIESGEILVGSFGPARRRVHTVLGETVSVAAQLEKLTVELASPVLLGPEVMEQAQPRGLYQGEFLLDGLTRPRKIHALPVDIDQGRLRIVYTAEAA